MKAIFSALKRSPKLSALVAVLTAAVVIPAGLLAWGPERPTYTTANAAPHVTFNSIVDNPAHGDERNFVSIKEAGASSATYTDNINLQGGKEYEVYVYYHNNAKSSLNASGKGIAKDVKLRMEMPAVVKAGQTASINGYISASNATPGTVYDDVKGKASSDIALRYVPSSAKIHNFGKTDGATLPDTLITTGTPLGFDSLNGVVPGCNEYAGYVTFRIKADQPNFTVEKTVSKHGQNAFGESTSVKAGEKVDYKIKYKNTGTTQQNNVTVLDELPQGMKYVAGTTQISNSKTGNKWSKVESNEIVKGGINIGSYAPGGAAYLTFTAIAEGECGSHKVINKAYASTNNGTKSDTADVTVTKECAPGEISVCELATKRIITIQEKDFDSNLHSKNLLDCTDAPLPPELPQTGVSGSALTLAGIGLLTAAAAYAVRSDRVRNLLRG